MTTAIISVSQHGWIAFVCYSGITSNEEVCVSILLLGPVALTRLHTQGAMTSVLRSPSHHLNSGVSAKFISRGDELNANSAALHRVEPYMHSAPREKDQRSTSVGGIEGGVSLPVQRSVIYRSGMLQEEADEARGSS